MNLDWAIGSGGVLHERTYGFTFDNIDWEEVRDVVDEIDELDDEELKELDADDLIARVSGDYVCTSCGSRKSVDTNESHPKTWCSDCGSVRTHRRDD